MRIHPASYGFMADVKRSCCIVLPSVPGLLPDVQVPFVAARLILHKATIPPAPLFLKRGDSKSTPHKDFPAQVVIRRRQEVMHDYRDVFVLCG